MANENSNLILMKSQDRRRQLSTSRIFIVQSYQQNGDSAGEHSHAITASRVEASTEKYITSIQGIVIPYP
jgi:hypothetical protein